MCAMDPGVRIRKLEILVEELLNSTWDESDNSDSSQEVGGIDDIDKHEVNEVDKVGKLDRLNRSNKSNRSYKSYKSDKSTEGAIRTKMLELDLPYSSNPIERINIVLEALNPSSRNLAFETE
jgi:hypothetical protein